MQGIQEERGKVMIPKDAYFSGRRLIIDLEKVAYICERDGMTMFVLENGEAVLTEERWEKAKRIIQDLKAEYLKD